jgi:hypothetical protein
MTTHTAIFSYYASADLDDGSLLCHRTTDATIEIASATGEISAGSAVYSAVFSDVAAGRYRLKLLSGGDVVATRDVEFAGTDAEVVETGYAVLNTAEREAIASIIYDTLTTHPVLEDSYGELFQNIAAIGAATQTKASNILDGVGWLLADATGAIAAPQSATATAVITAFGSTYTVQYAGLTSTGVRTAPTLSKA